MQLRQRPDTNRRHFHYGKCWKKYLLLYRAVEVTPWPMWVMTHSWIACLGCGVGHPQFTSENSLFEPPIDGMSDFAGVLCTGCWNLRSYSRASKHDSFGSPHRTTRLPNLKNVLICFLFFFFLQNIRLGVVNIWLRPTDDPQLGVLWEILMETPLVHC